MQNLRAGGISARGTPRTSSLLRSATSARFVSNSSFILIGALCSGFYSNCDDQVELIFLCWIWIDAGEEGPLALETILCCNCSVHTVPAHQRARLGKKEEGAPAWAWRGGNAGREGARSTAYSGLTVMARASRHEDGDDQRRGSGGGDSNTVARRP
jgi:hypothetical protein